MASLAQRRQHDGTRFFVGGRQVAEGEFWQEVALASATSTYDHGAYEVKLTPQGIGAALRLLEARRPAEAGGAGR